ncbi:MAG: hypothetical protein KDA45_06440, partial [Planctomycetales bacterium]|nr:hypothetical protein [Planctomycetales bacterium]
MRNHLLLGCSLLLSGIALGCNQAEPQPVSSAPPDAEQSSTQSSPAEPLDVGDQSPDTSASNAPREQGGSQPSPEEGQRLEGNQIVAPTLNDQTEMQRRPFATLQAKDTDVPEELIEHLREIDSALQDLVLAGSSNMLDEGSFRQAGLRLGRMKQEAGKRLANAPSATAEQRKSGMLAQLIALSHMSGLRHVESAKELSRFAEQLVSSGDPDLAHQSRVVLLGFELQALQNGVHSAPEQLLAGLEGLFERPEDRGF